MTRAGEALAAEIARQGPVTFHRFMETALYHPEHGYYRRARDPFGKGGDFFTAEQLQPVFGILIATQIRELYRKMGEPRDFTVVELGAGRNEMADAFSEWRYVPVDVGAGRLPDRFTGVVFSNEFFDALPVHVARWQEGEFREERVAFRNGGFVWDTGARVSVEIEEYLRRYCAPPEEGRRYEANLDAFAWMKRIGHSLVDGYVLTIDYGYTRVESIRFPDGTLMGYRAHTARENVLDEPGARDITAHVNFTALEDAGARAGLRMERLETLAQTLLRAGEPDRFAAALHAGSAEEQRHLVHEAAGDALHQPALRAGSAEELRRRLQLKTLLFGMGETFRVLLLERAG